MPSSATIVTVNEPSSSCLKDLGPNDVLLGRGTGPNEHIGNIHFRALVRDIIQAAGLRELYGTVRAKLAKDVMREVQAKGGKFLKRTNTSNGKKNNTKEGYEEVADVMALDKTKQSFRHQLRAIMPRQRPANIPKSALVKGFSAAGSSTLRHRSDGTANETSLIKLKNLSSFAIPAALPVTSMLGLRDPLRISIGSSSRSIIHTAVQNELASLYLAESMIARENAMFSRIVSDCVRPNDAAVHASWLMVQSLPGYLQSKHPSLQASTFEASNGKPTIASAYLDAVMSEVRQLR